MRIGLLLVLLGMTVVGHCAAVYSWVDEHGVVHFDDQPPPDRDADHADVPNYPKVGTVVPDPVKPAPRTRKRSSGRATKDRMGERQKREERCHLARQAFADVRARRRAGYRASESRALDRRENRARADIRFYCR